MIKLNNTHQQQFTRGSPFPGMGGMWIKYDYDEAYMNRLLGILQRYEAAVP